MSSFMGDEIEDGMVGHVARMWKKGNVYRVLLRELKESASETLE
jgi:hypothetical protein